MEKIKVMVKKSPGDEDIPLPRYMSPNAAGMDLYAAVKKDTTLKPGEIKLISTGITIALPPGFEAQIRPRSGLAIQHGISIPNTPGTIDADYRGEVRIILINLGESPFTVKRGDRIAQMIINKVYQAHLELSTELSSTKRNEGGFGHTGI
ncbi:MAG: dUTP diphosphatase [Deltaproteobacteria bacterium]|nr:dUTP diphosphatase [Deltaproteobacteria bacterium]MBW2553769.1 dUTP diphosphatase [Deltaproteobacteria bacterium]NOQ86235.1 dUTP diphosphatase [Deltaproteobacteria bacterium]